MDILMVLLHIYLIVSVGAGGWGVGTVMEEGGYKRWHLPLVFVLLLIFWPLGMSVAAWDWLMGEGS